MRRPEANRTAPASSAALADRHPAAPESCSASHSGRPGQPSPPRLRRAILRQRARYDQVGSRRVRAGGAETIRSTSPGESVHARLSRVITLSGESVTNRCPATSTCGKPSRVGACAQACRRRILIGQLLLHLIRKPLLYLRSDGRRRLRVRLVPGIRIRIVARRPGVGYYFVGRRRVVRLRVELIGGLQRRCDRKYSPSANTPRSDTRAPFGSRNRSTRTTDHVGRRPRVSRRRRPRIKRPAVKRRSVIERRHVIVQHPAAIGVRHKSLRV